MTAVNRHKVGMLLFISSESFFFIALLFTYLYLAKSFGFYPAKSLKLFRTAMFSIALFSSSGTMWLAERAFRRRSRDGFHFWMVVTMALGVVFLFGEGWEYMGLVKDGITMDLNTFGSAFFTVTGFHALHVITGLTMLLTYTVLSMRRAVNHTNEVALSVIAYYWHFVDVVWLFVFGTVYLLVRAV